MSESDSSCMWSVIDRLDSIYSILSEINEKLGKKEDKFEDKFSRISEEELEKIMNKCSKRSINE